MRSSLVVRASDCQCTSCNGPGFDPSIRRHSKIWGAADEAVLNIVRKKKRKNPPKNYLKKKKKNISMPRNIVVCRLCAAVLSAEKQQRAYCPMCAGVAGFDLAYHDSPRRCCLWIDMTPTDGEFPSPTAYIMAALLYKQNFCSHSSQERGGQILTLQ